MGIPGLGEGEGAVDDRGDLTALPHAGQLGQKLTDTIPLLPEVAHVDAEHPLVGVHQLQRMKDRGGGQRLGQRPPRLAPLGGVARRQTETEQPPHRCQAPVALPERGAALGIEGHLHSPTVGDAEDLALEVLSPVVDGMVESVLVQPGMLAGAGRPDGHRPQVAGQLQGGEPYAAAGRVDEHGVALPHRTQVVEHHIGGEEGHRDSGRLHQIGAVVDPGDLALGHCHHVGVATESGERHHPVPDGELGDRLAHPVHLTCHLVAHHHRRRRCIGVEAGAGRDVGEVDAGSGHPDADLVRARLRIVADADRQHIRSTEAGNPYLSHMHS